MYAQREELQVAWISKSRLKALALDHQTWSPSQVAAYQLKRINNLWDGATRNIPHYRNLVKRLGLPKSFDSLQQYIALVPPLTKDVFQTQDVPYWHQKPRPNRKRITGGSTATPIQIPTWRREYEANRLDPWLGRSWYGIDPCNRLLLYWGHSHLLGEGWRGKVNGWLRSIKDLVQNYKRCSSYDMSQTALRNAGRCLLESKARFVLGYSCYLDRLAKTNAHLSSAFADLGLKAVIGVAEGFPFEDSEPRIEEVFQAPVGMEYGSVETGLIAHTHPTGGYRVFWNNYLLESCPGSALQEVFVTSLFRRCTPLFRYQLNDRYEFADESQQAAGCSTLSFGRVVGRSNSSISLPNGQILHSESATHIVRGISKITGYQFVSWKDQVTLNVTANKPLGDEDLKRIYGMARRIDSQFGKFLRIQEVPDLDRTVAGKTPMILNKDRPYRVGDSEHP